MSTTKYSLFTLKTPPVVGNFVVGLNPAAVSDDDKNIRIPIADFALIPGLDAINIGDGTVTNTEFQFINTLTSNAQTQINNKITKTPKTTAIASLASTGELVPRGSYLDPAITNGTIGGATERHYLNRNNALRISQKGSVTHVKVNVTDVDDANLTAFFIELWRKDGSTYDRLSQEDILPKLKDNQLNLIELTTPVTVVEGDYIGYGWTATSPVTSIMHSQGDFAANAAFSIDGVPTATDFDWEAQTEVTSPGVPVVLGPAPIAVMLGNSMTAGTNGHHAYTSKDAAAQADDPTFSWPRKLADVFSWEHQNMGIAGEESFEGLARYKVDVLDKHPALCFMLWGRNDVAANVTRDEYSHDMREMIVGCLNNATTPILISILPSDALTNLQSQEADAFNIIQQELATEFNILFIDARADTGQFRSGGDAGNLWDIIPAFNADDTHFTELGYQQVSDTIETVLNAADGDNINVAQIPEATLFQTLMIPSPTVGMTTIQDGGGRITFYNGTRWNVTLNPPEQDIAYKSEINLFTGNNTFRSESLPVIEGIRVTATDNVIRTALVATHETTLDAIAGFGSQLSFGFKDNTAEGSLGSIGFSRAATDTEGEFFIKTNSPGVNRFKIRTDGTIECFENDLINVRIDTGVIVTGQLAIARHSTLVARTDIANNFIGLNTFTRANFPVVTFARTTTGTSAISSGPKMLVTSSGTMADGFGTGIGVRIAGLAVSEQQIARFGAVRDGADDQGKFFVHLNTASNPVLEIGTTGLVDWPLSQAHINIKIDANATGNAITNIDVADLANGVDGELITWDAAGAPATVGVGIAAQVLTSNGPGAAPTFQANPAGFTDPMTTRGDIIIRNTSNVTDRLAIGANTFVLTSDGTDISWSAAGAASLPVVDTTSIVEGSADATKEMRFEVDGLTTATVRVMTVPDKDMTLAGTNDKLDAFAATTSAELITVISDETGSGLLVFGTSPTIVTPTIASFTNATHDHSDAAGGGNLTNSALTSGAFSNITGIGAQSQALNMNGQSVDSVLDVTYTGRQKLDKGADIASASGLTLGADGNVFDITGTTTINTISPTNWQAGSVVVLQFDGILTVTHNSGGTNDILLGDQSNMTTAAGDVLTLFYNGTDWVEVSRSVVGGSGGGGILTADSTADLIRNNTEVMADIPGLFIALEANKLYQIYAIVFANSPTGTPDSKMQFTVPSGATMLWRAPGGSIVAKTQADNDTFILDSATRKINLDGTIQMSSTAGNIQIQARQSVATVEDTKFLEDSIITALEIT